MKTKIWLATAVTVLSIGVQGCTLKNQFLRIDPEVQVKESKMGNDKMVGLRVSDPRADKKLGEVGDPNQKMVDVRVEEDPSPAMYQRVRQALSKMGFAVEPYSDGMDRTLTIELLTLDLDSVKKPLTFNTEIRAGMAAHATNSTAYYDRQFNVRTRMDGAAPPYEKDSTKLVNRAVSQALEDLLADDQLLDLLAR